MDMSICGFFLGENARWCDRVAHHRYEVYCNLIYFKKQFTWDIINIYLLAYLKKKKIYLL